MRHPHCLAILLRIFEVAVKRRGPAPQRGLKLREVADKNDQLRSDRLRRSSGRVSDGCASSHGRRRIQRPAQRLGPEFLQLRHRLASQPVQLAHGNNDRAFEMILELRELERCSAQPAELLFQPLGAQRLFRRDLQRNR